MASVIAGFRVIAVTPNIPSLVAGDTLTVFAEIDIDRRDAHRRDQLDDDASVLTESPGHSVPFVAVCTLRPT